MDLGRTKTFCVLIVQLEIPHNLFTPFAQIGQLFGIILKKALITWVDWFVKAGIRDSDKDQDRDWDLCFDWNLDWYCDWDLNLDLDRAILGPKFFDIHFNISSVVEFQRWWVLKSKFFGQESTYLKDFFLNSVDEWRFVKNWAWF